MPSTVLTTLVGSVIMILAWILIDNRIKASEGAVSHQVTLLHQFVLYMGIFFMLMFLPHVSLNFNPSLFPLLMAWGYVIGHIFMYVAFLSIGRLFFSVIPRLAKKELIFFKVGLVITFIATVVNAITMVWGVRPQFDTESGVSLLNAHPVIGATIGLFALVCVVPLSILMIRNGILNPATRVRSFLLGGGLLIMMIGGPLHDVARTASLYALADAVTTFALILVACGIAYRIEDRLTVSQTVATTR